SGTGSVDEFLQDMNANVLAAGQHGPSNFIEAISNFVAPASGTYYIDIHGNNITYSLTVTRNAAFDTEPNNTQVTAQPLSAGHAALGALSTPPGLQIGSKFEGLSFFDSTCGCI